MRFMMYLLPERQIAVGFRERALEKETLQATSLQTTSVSLRVVQ
jgi:hypothetical protein